MKEDVIAANLANLRQSISELKECIEKQNVTVSKSEQSVKVEFDEKTIYTGIAKSFCTCWNEALSVIKKHIWQQQPNTLPFSLWFPKLIDLFKQKSKLLEYLYRHESHGGVERSGGGAKKDGTAGTEKGDGQQRNVYFSGPEYRVSAVDSGEYHRLSEPVRQCESGCDSGSFAGGDTDQCSDSGSIL